MEQTMRETGQTDRPVATPRRSRRSFLLLCGGAAVAALVPWGLMQRQGAGKVAMEGGGGLKAVTRNSRALGSDISMVVLHEDAAVCQRAMDGAFKELARVERVMSIYRPESQVSRLNQDGVIAHPDPYLVRVLEQSKDMAERSGGAFDVTVQPLWVMYAAAQRQGGLPSDAQIGRERLKVDWRGVSISAKEIRLKNAGMSITLNGIAQGFAADRAMEAIRRVGIEHALVNTGEIASLGRKAKGQAWTVGIQHPREKDAYLGLAKLAGRCMSTSGDYETVFTEDKAYNHIFEPWSGRSPQAFSSVTVVAATATEADALSTAIFVLGVDKGMELARATQAADVLLVMKDGRTVATEGFPWNS